MNQRISAHEERVFKKAIRALTGAGVPFVVAGAYAMFHYAGIWRNTKDMDLFLRPPDAIRALDVLAAEGFCTWVHDEHWLAKATMEDSLVDLIYGSGNWLQVVDDRWFERSEPGEILGQPVRFAPVEEIIASKAYVAVRHRWDGTDIMHLLEAHATRIDWDHLLGRFEPHWELLYSYLLLFWFVYPTRRADIPRRIMGLLGDLTERTLSEPRPDEPICRGTLLDPYGYLVDIQERGYVDAREHVARQRGYDEGVIAAAREAAERTAREMRGT